MADIDSLEISIQAKADSASKSLDDLVKKLGLIAEGISVIGKNSGLEEFAKKAQEATKGFAGIQNIEKTISTTIESQMQKVSKRLEEITAKYKDLGKGFTFQGSTANIQKQIDKYTNSLETAKLKKQELEAAGKTGGAMYENAVSETIKYTNIIESLKEQLTSIKNETPQLKINISGLEETGRTLIDFEERLRHFDAVIEAGGEESGAGLTFPVSGLELSLEQLRSLYPEATQLISSYEAEIERAKELSSAVPYQNYGNIDFSAFDQMGDKLRGLGEKLSLIEVPEVREENLDKLRNNLDKTEIKLDELRTKLANGLTMGNISENVDDSGFVRLQEKIAYTEKQAEALRNKIAEIGNADGTDWTEKIHAALSKLFRVGKVSMSALSGMASAIKKMGSVSGSAISKLVSFGKSISNLGKTSKKASGPLAGGFKTVLKYAFGIRSLYTLMNKLRRAAEEGFKNLAQYSTETNTSFSMLTSSLEALKNSSAVAFSPILNVIAPILSSFIDMLTKAFNTVGQFFAALTGQSSVAQAKKNFTDYAASVSEAGGATKKAGKDVRGGLQAFDELNLITSNKGYDTSNGGNISPADMFETISIDNGVSDFAKKLKDAWVSSDFTEIGTILGTKLKKALDSINWEPIKQTSAKIGKSIGTLISGSVETKGLANSIGKTIGESVNTGIAGINSFLDNTHWDSVGIFIGDGLNEIVNTIDWEGAGHLLAQKFNAIFETLGSTAATFNWSDFGLRLAESVNTFITDFEWAENGARLGELAEGLLDSIISFLRNTDWQKIGVGVAEFIGEIDWSGIFEKAATALSEAAKTVLDMLIGFTEELDWGKLGTELWDSIVGIIEGIDWGGLISKGFELLGAAIGGTSALIVSFAQSLWESLKSAFENTKEYFSGYIEDAGGNVILGLLNGIWEGIKNIGTWIYDHIFKPFIDGFKKAFGIASPSKVMVEQGKYIIKGLLKGFLDNIGSIWEWAKKIPGKLLGFFNDLPSKFLEIGENIISGLWNGIKNTWNKFSSGISEIGSGIIDTFKDVFSIHSPSRVMFELGDYTMQGFKLGLENLYRPIIASVKSFGSDLQIAPAPNIESLYGNHQVSYTGASNHGANPYIDYSLLSGKLNDAPIVTLF